MLKDMHQHESSDGSGTQNPLEFLWNLEDVLVLYSILVAGQSNSKVSNLKSRILNWISKAVYF